MENQLQLTLPITYVFGIGVLILFAWIGGATITWLTLRESLGERTELRDKYEVELEARVQLERKVMQLERQLSDAMGLIEDLSARVARGECESQNFIN